MIPGISFTQWKSIEEIALWLGGALLILFYAYAKFSVPSRWTTRIFLFVWRAFLLLVVFFIILDPYWNSEKEHEWWVGVLVDTSSSMRAKNGDAVLSRIEAVNAFMKNDPYWAELSRDRIRKIYTVDSDLKEADASQTFAASRGQSALNHALQTLQDQYGKNPDLLGWILFSDGNATDGPRDSTETYDAFSRFSVPWITVGAGEEGVVPNIEIKSLAMQKNIFTGEMVRVRVNWKSTTHATGSVLLRADLDGEKYLERNVAAGSESTDFEMKTDKPGIHRIDLILGPDAREASDEDNHVRSWFQAHPRKIRVFYGESFYKDENRFKKALEEDKEFEVRFASSLIGFSKKNRVPFIKDPFHGLPRTREEFLNYDAVVLSDVRRNLLREDQIRWLRELVEEEGGALIMIGGLDSFGDGGYAGTEIEEMLPVAISEEYKTDHFLAARGTSDQPFRAVIAAGAEPHPILQILDDPPANKMLWDNMPLLGGYNFVGRLKPGASLIWQHPEDRSTFGPRTILAVQNFGNGKTLAFTSDITDNWGHWFQDWRADGNKWIFAEFWRKTVKWLTENRSHRTKEPLEVRSEPEILEENQMSDWHVVLPEENENGALIASNKTVIPRLDRGIQRMDGFRRNDSGFSSPGRDNGLLIGALSLRISQNEKSIFLKEFSGPFRKKEISFAIPGLKAGDYLLTLEWDRENLSPLISEHPFTIHPSREESRHLEFSPTLLRELALRTQGTYLNLSETDRLKEALTRLLKLHLRKHSSPYWHDVRLFLLMLGLLSLDWLIRKRAGLE